jgi:hypothetical protein
LRHNRYKRRGPSGPRFRFEACKSLAANIAESEPRKTDASLDGCLTAADRDLGFFCPFPSAPTPENGRLTAGCGRPAAASENLLSRVENTKNDRFHKQEFVGANMFPYWVDFPATAWLQLGGVLIAVFGWMINVFALPGQPS